MSNVFSKEKRSEVMSRIRSKGNAATELRMMALMREHGIKGWRRNSVRPERPDFVFPGRKVAVFVDGCFWHGCPEHGTQPKQNAEFWEQKLAANRKRDRLVTRTLRGRGWRVARFWEHDLARKREGRTVGRLGRILDL